MKKEAGATRSKVLRDAGLRRTGSRLAVLEVLEGATSPCSHAEVAEALAGDGVDRATVYRNLLVLTEAGLVRRTDLGDHVWRFELVRRGAVAHERTHPHFYCTDCGSVACMEDVTVTLDGPQATVAKAFEVQLRGVCDACVVPKATRKGARA